MSVSALSSASGEFSAQEWLRYTRHIQLSEVGVSGQIKLKQARIAIVGVGGLGSPVALYLAAAGIGKITLIDSDVVDLSNLQRQIIYTQADIGKNKSAAAAQHLQELNSAIDIVTYAEDFSLALIAKLSPDFDLLLDCTDNFATRYLINDFCCNNKIPWVYASVQQFFGQCSLFIPGQACFRCVFPHQPDTAEDCNSVGVLGVLPGILGMLQANEALKYVLGLPTPLANHLGCFDAKALTLRRFRLHADPKCACQTGEFSLAVHNGDYQRACIALTGHDAQTSLSVAAFNTARDKTQVYVVDVRTLVERQSFHIGGEHIQLDLLEKALPSLDRSCVYYCYCQTGLRSQTAVDLLRQSGFTAFNLRGGLVEWLKNTSE